MVNKAVQVYFNKQDKGKKELLVEARKLLMATVPNCDEEFAWGVPVYDGGRFYLAALKKQVNFGFAIVGLSPEEVKEFEGTGKTARHLKIHSEADLRGEKIKRLIELVHTKASPPPDYKK